MHIFRVFVVVAIVLLIFFSPQIRSIVKGYKETSIDKATHSQEKVKDFSTNLEQMKKEKEEEKIDAFIEDSLEAADKIKSKDGKIKILQETLSYYQSKNDHEKILKYTDDLYNLATDENIYSLQAKSLYYYVFSQMALAQDEQDITGKDYRVENAKKISLEALKIMEEKKIKDSNLEGQFYYLLGLTLMESSSSDLFQAEKMLDVAKERFEKVNDQKGIIQSIIKLAHIQFLQGEIKKAETILTPLKENNLEISEQIQFDYMLSQIEAAKGQINKAISLAEKATEKASTVEKRKINQLLFELKKIREMHKEPF